MRRSRGHGAIYYTAHWGAVPFVGWALCPVVFKHHALCFITLHLTQLPQQGPLQVDAIRLAAEFARDHTELTSPSPLARRRGMHQPTPAHVAALKNLISYMWRTGDFKFRYFSSGCNVRSHLRGITAQAATNATSHGRRSFLVVMAASWRSRQRPSPLRGGHGGGLCPFVVVTAEVFYTSTQKQRKKSLHMRLPPFSSQEPAWGLRLFAALAPPGEFFGEIIEKKKKKAEKSHLHWPWAVVMWRSSPRRLGGHGGLLRACFSHISANFFLKVFFLRRWHEQNREFPLWGGGGGGAQRDVRVHFAGRSNFLYLSFKSQHAQQDGKRTRTEGQGGRLERSAIRRAIYSLPLPKYVATCSKPSFDSSRSLKNCSWSPAHSCCDFLISSHLRCSVELTAAPLFGNAVAAK